MKTIKLTVFLMVLISCSVQSQQVGDFSPSVQKYGLGKLKKAPKKVYIANFNINFEVYRESVDYKQGGEGFGSTRRSSATARAALGLAGVEADEIQKITNQLYTEYIAELKSAGLEIITVDDAAKTNIYEGWKRSDGPYVKESGLPGVMVSVPDGYSFMYKGENKNGKKKKGLMGGNFVAPALSKQLDNAIIANVELYVMFTEDGQNLFKGNAAKVKIFTNLRVVGSYAVQAPIDSGVRLKGAESTDRIVTKVSFDQGKQGLGSVISYNGGVKKPLEINGVIKKEKVVAFQSQGSSTPTSFSGYNYSNLNDRFSKTTKWIEVDGQKYAQGLYNACKKTIEEHATTFLKNM